MVSPLSIARSSFGKKAPPGSREALFHNSFGGFEHDTLPVCRELVKFVFIRQITNTHCSPLQPPPAGWRLQFPLPAGGGREGDYYFPASSFDLVQAALTAFITTPRNPPFSRACRAAMVVPPGEVTFSFSSVGCSPVSTTIRAAPRTVWAAN